jgi:hypothetical protein
VGRRVISLIEILGTGGVVETGSSDGDIPVVVFGRLFVDFDEVSVERWFLLE